MQQPIYNDIPFLVSVSTTREEETSNAIINDNTSQSIKILLFSTLTKGNINIKKVLCQPLTRDNSHYSFGEGTESISYKPKTSTDKLKNIKLEPNKPITITIELKTSVSPRTGIVFIDIDYTKNGKEHQTTIPAFVAIRNYKLSSDDTSKNVTLDLYSWKNPLYNSDKKALIGEKKEHKIWEIQADKLLIYDRTGLTKVKAIELGLLNEEGGLIYVYQNYNGSRYGSKSLSLHFFNMELYKNNTFTVRLSAFDDAYLKIRNLKKNETIYAGVTGDNNMRRFVLKNSLGRGLVYLNDYERGSYLALKKAGEKTARVLFTADKEKGGLVSYDVALPTSVV